MSDFTFVKTIFSTLCWVKRSPSKEVSERRDFPSMIMFGKQHCFLTFMGYQRIGPQAISRGYEVIRSTRVWLARERKHNLDIIMLAGSRPEVCDFTPSWKDKLITEMETGRLAFRISIFRCPQLHKGSNMAAYLPAPSVDAKGGQKGVEDHVTGLYVDWRLPFPHRAKIPSWVHQSPERRN